ncbi:endolytic transglycosylase MltG [Demequina soli]|uniref:endolytic transglycosylase MltG n=1 Tax=Demequina soli TaxID=1638987 RepID=UPI000785389A|nr:endolytic transglycosylase MltG [Demequina soli]
MTTAHDILRDLERSGAREFETTALAGDLSPVTRRVRRQRAARAGVGSVAGLAVLGAGTYGLLRAGDHGAVAPAVDSPAPSTSAAPTPDAPVRALGVTAGERAERVAEALAGAFDVTPEEATAALVASLPPEADGQVEGWLAPGSYAGTSLEGAASAMVGGQVQRMSDAVEQRARWQHILTIASIVENEAPDAAVGDWRMLTGLIENRLAAGMTLDLESPLVYVTHADERTVSDDGFAVDSPYNTFMYEGLPPTPIGNPAETAIAAAADPLESNALYVVRTDAGGLLFAETFHDFQLLLVDQGQLDPRDVLPE